MDVMMNCDVPSSLSFTISTLQLRHVAPRAFKACDLAFFVPVAITESPYVWWATVYYTGKESIDVIHLISIVGHNLLRSRVKVARQCANNNRP